jgi:hypothetical protein
MDTDAHHLPDGPGDQRHGLPTEIMPYHDITRVPMGLGGAMEAMPSHDPLMPPRGGYPHMRQMPLMRASHSEDLGMEAMSGRKRSAKLDDVEALMADDDDDMDGLMSSKKPRVSGRRQRPAGLLAPAGRPAGLAGLKPAPGGQAPCIWSLQRSSRPGGAAAGAAFLPACLPRHKRRRDARAPPPACPRARRSWAARSFSRPSLTCSPSRATSASRATTSWWTAAQRWCRPSSCRPSWTRSRCACRVRACAPAC